MKDMPKAGFRNLDRKYVVGVVLVKDATGYWIASVERIGVHQKNFYIWLVWALEREPLDNGLKRNMGIYMGRR